MNRYSRKSAPEVVAGKVRKKNNWELSDSYYHRSQPWPVIDRKRPGEGYRHLLTKHDILQFIRVLPDWDELSKGLNAIVLAPGEYGTNGYHTPGVVHICAWEKDFWIDYAREHYEEHKDIFDRLGVPAEAMSNGGVLCKFDQKTARAYQLLHILLHELGHHHDRMTTKNKWHSGRGEPYAEAYARKYMDQIWERCAPMLELY